MPSNDRLNVNPALFIITFASQSLTFKTYLSS